MSVSSAAMTMVASGNTSRGHATLLTIDMFATMLWPPPLREFEKNVHGTRPRYVKRTYGAPPVSTCATLVNTMVKTTMSRTGVNIAQPIPSTDCLYRAR